MSDRCAIVTGGAGFIGSHVVDALLADDWRVVVVDDLSTGDARRVASEATLEVADITDRGALDPVLDAARPAAIFHLAAQASVTSSVADPGQDLEINVRGTLNVLEGATRHGAPVVYTSTGGALYGDARTLPTPEDEPPAPISPYGASKWAAEAYLTTWREATGIPHAVCRLGNVYGPRQNVARRGGCRGDLQSTSCRTDALRPCSDSGSRRATTSTCTTLRRRCSQPSGKPGVFNVSTGVETPVTRLFELLRAAANMTIEGELAPLRTGELERSCLDSSRARDELGWRAEIGLEEGLAATYHALVDEFDAAP